MAPASVNGKLYNVSTSRQHIIEAKRGAAKKWGRCGGKSMIVALAAAIFVALFGWGANYFGWSDPDGKVQLALFASFVLGAICGYKSKG